MSNFDFSELYSFLLAALSIILANLPRRKKDQKQEETEKSQDEK